VASSIIDLGTVSLDRVADRYFPAIDATPITA